MSESYPRLRNDAMSLSNVMHVPVRNTGRLDLVCVDNFGIPSMYRPIAAANGIRNPLALRATIRPAEESVRNELVMRGMSEDEIDAELDDILDDVVLGDYDWLSYDNRYNGAITEVDNARYLAVPSADDMIYWNNKYYR